MPGWFKVHRSLWDSWIADDPEHLAAWLTILAHVNWRPAKCLIKGRLLHVAPGESVQSYNTWAITFRWKKSRVVRFFKMLEKSECIRLKNETATIRLTVVNWELYQQDQNDIDTEAVRNPVRSRYDRGTIAESIQEGKNNKKGRIKNTHKHTEGFECASEELFPDHQDLDMISVPPAWVKRFLSLGAKGCKPRHDNFPCWARIVDTHGVDVVAAAVTMLPPDARWPANVEAKITTDGICQARLMQEKPF